MRGKFREICEVVKLTEQRIQDTAKPEVQLISGLVWLKSDISNLMISTVYSVVIVSIRIGLLHQTENALLRVNLNHS